MAYPMKIAFAGLSLLAADASGQEMSIRPSCRLLVDKVEKYDDATVGLMCRRSIDAKQCSAMLSALGPRPWSKPKREAACQRFEGDLLQRRILFEFPKMPDIGGLGAKFAKQATEVASQGTNAVLDSADSMIDQAVGMMDQAAAITDSSLGNTSMDGVVSAKKTVAASMDEVHKQADAAKASLREDLLDSVGKLTSAHAENSKEFSVKLQNEVDAQMGKFQSSLEQGQDSFNKIMDQAKDQALDAQKKTTDLSTEFMSSLNKALDTAADPELKKLAEQTKGAMNGLPGFLEGMPSTVDVPDFLKGKSADAAPADSIASVTPAPAAAGLAGAMDEIMDAANGQNATAAVDKAKDALGQFTKISQGASSKAKNSLKGFKGLLGGIFGKKYEKGHAVDISNGPLASFTGFAVLAAALTGIAVAAQRFRQRPSQRLASTVMLPDEEGGAE